MRKELIRIAVQLEYHAETWFTPSTFSYRVLFEQARRIREVARKYRLLKRKGRHAKK